MTIATLTAAVLLSMGAGVPPPIIAPQGMNTDQPSARAQIQTLQAFVGEWEGQIRVTNERGTSVSMVGLSAIEDVQPGNVLMTFQGIAFAQPIEGIGRLSHCTTESTTVSSWYDSLSDQSLSFAQTCHATIGSALQPAASTTSLAFESLALGHNLVIRQTLTLESEEHAVLEISAQLPGDDAQTLLSMDLYRLPAGQLSMGAGMSSNAGLLARLNTTNANTATANVNPDAE